MKTISWISILLSIIGTQTLFSQSDLKKDYAAINGALSYRMLGDEVNDPQREWSYTPKQTTVIGVPFTPAPVQVTFDGAIYTRDSELFFFYGLQDKPLMATQKTFYQGWIPVIEYDFQEDEISYRIEMFGYNLKGESSENSIQFVRILLKNNSTQEKQAGFGAAVRASGMDHRMGGPLFSENAVYRFEGNEFYRDDNLVYHFSGTPEKYAVRNIPYETSFGINEFHIDPATAIGIVRYAPLLEAGGEYEIILKYPRVAIEPEHHPFIEKYRIANYNAYRSDCIDFWTRTIEGNGYFSIPEKRVNDSYKAGLVHLMLSTRTHTNGVKRQGSGLPYDDIFFNDFVDMRLIYDIAGHPDFVELNFEWLRNAVNEEGLFVDSSVSHSREIMTSHGQALYSVCNHFMYRDDKKLAQKMLPTVRKAVGLIAGDHTDQPNGLVRPSLPFDAEMIEGYYTSHNLWCLVGLRSAIVYAEYLGLKKEAGEWRTLENSYRQALLKAIDHSAHADGYVPTGLYEYKKGKDCGWEEFRTDQDWENMLLVYPVELLSTDDRKVGGTLSHIRKNRFREGIMTYRNGQHLHQYATTNLTNQHIAVNDQKTALYDLYHILLHNGSTHEGFENMIEPWADRDPEPIPAPHAWAAAKTSLLIRNGLIREYGGNAGLDMKERSLYLFSLLSPAWVQPGEKLEIINIRTEFGVVNATLAFKEKGATLIINPRFTRPPKEIRMAVPFLKKINKVYEVSGQNIRLEKDYIVCGPKVKQIEIEWEDIPQENHLHTLLNLYRTEPGVEWVCPAPEAYPISPKDKIGKGCSIVVIPGLERGFLLPEEESLPLEILSFDLVRKAYLMEYRRRRYQYLQTGKSLLKIDPPAFR